MATAEAIEREVEACLAAAMPDVDLREVVLMGAGDDAMVRVVVDHPGGVDHGVCEAVTRAMWAEGLGDRFGIEVWSPGPEPPLRVRRHYEAAVGHRVRLKVADDGGKPRTREGVLAAIGADSVSLVNDGGAREIALADIRRAYDLEPHGADA